MGGISSQEGEGDGEGEEDDGEEEEDLVELCGPRLHHAEDMSLLCK